MSGHRTTKAIKKGFVYPANATVKKGGGLVAPMTLSPAIGHYGYTHTGSSFTLTRHLSGGKRYTVTKTLADID